MNDNAGESFGKKYRLLRKIADGGMAEVFLANMQGPSGFAKQCVIKRVLPEYSRQPEFAKMMINEARIVALLNHPGIVQVFDFGLEGEHYYICMEYVNGASLHQIVRRASKQGSALGVRMAASMGALVAAALDYAHEARNPNGEFLNLVHRDISPGNILVSRTGQVKLTDFGIVKVSDTDDKTRAGVIKGKFAYMSPEQVGAEELDRRSDVFSLGVVLYECATGRSLFRRKDAGAALMAVTMAQVPRPTEFDPSFPEEFERILLKALARDRADRYQTAGELAADLEIFNGARSWGVPERYIAEVVEKLVPPNTELEVVKSGTGSNSQELSSSFATPASGATPASYITPTPTPAPNHNMMQATLAIAICTALSFLLWLFILLTSD